MYLKCKFTCKKGQNVEVLQIDLQNFLDTMYFRIENKSRYKTVTKNKK